MSKKIQIILFIALTFAIALPAGGAENLLYIPIVLPQTEKGQENAIAGWKIREWSGKADVEVVETEAGKALHLKSNATSIALYREDGLDVKKHPFINWQWMVKSLPKGGDVRDKAKDDQAIQLYVIFPYKWPASINSRLIGYIWDSTAPAGAVFTSTKSDKVKYIVVKSGQNGLGRWFSEKRNVYDDYKMVFNEEPPVASGISVMIDSDDTKSSAESYIANIFLADNQ